MNKQYSVRMRAEGGAAVKAEFVAVGQAGKQAFLGISNSQKSAGQSASVFAANLDKEKASFDGLRASIDPAFAAAQRFERQQEQVNRAVRLGIATQIEGAKVLKAAQLEYQSFNAIMNRSGVAANKNTFVYQNMARQINQVGQQGLVTGDYLTALSIQLPDILGSFASLPLIIGGAAFAVGASFIPKLFEAEEAAKTFEEQLSDLTAATNAYRDAVDSATVSQSELQRSFGADAGNQARFLEIQQEAARINAERALARTSVSVAGGFADFSFGATGDDIRNAADAEAEYASRIEEIAILFEGTQELSKERVRQLSEERERLTELAGGLSSIEQPLAQLQDKLGLSREEALSVAAALADLNTAEGIKEQGRAAKALASTIFSVTDALKGQGDDVLTLYERLLDLARSADAQAAAARKAAEQREADAIRAQVSAQQIYAQSRQDAQAAQATAQEMLANLAAEVELRDLIGQYGAESRQVAEFRLEAEREVYEETVRALDVSEDMKEALMAAWDAANGISETDFAGPIERGADEAARLARNLAWAARGQQIVNAARENPDFFDNRGERGESGLAGETDPNRWNIRLNLPGVDLPPNPRTKKSRSSGGGRSRGRQVNDQVREAERIFRETRTEAEKYAAEMADLNELHQMGYLDAETYGRALNNLEQDYRSAGSASEFFSNEIGRGLTDAIRNGKSLSDVMGNVAGNIADAALQASLLGQGPLADLFGTSGGNGIIQDLVGGLFNAFSPRPQPVATVRPRARPASVPSFDGGGGTGPGVRSGGVDGKGGFYALLHPNETVLDHEKGQGVGVSVNLIVENRASDVEVIEERTPGGDPKLIIVNTMKEAFLSGKMNRTMRDTFGVRAKAVAG